MTAQLNLAEAPSFAAQGRRHLERIALDYPLPPAVRRGVEALSLVFPFRVNEHVLNLIDWSNVPADPIYQLVFPQPGMLSEADERALHEGVDAGRTPRELAPLIDDIRGRLNPHPAGQLNLNVPTDSDGLVLDGVQHKYRQTALYFPSNGQTCHAYCAYCFRWPQFVGDADLKFSAPDPNRLVAYLKAHPETSDVLITGGDPLIMRTQQLQKHLEPLLEVASLRTVRLGSKSLAYWPQRFVTDPDADDLLRLLEKVVRSGRKLAFMAHFSHPRELEPEITRTAVRRILDTGAAIYCQAPLMAHVNDSATTWNRMWRDELAAGMVPYYLFVARDTGGQAYYKVPLVRAAEIFSQAYRELPGLARTVRGPVMSSTPGKVMVDGVVEFGEERALALHLTQARRPELVDRPFFAKYSEDAAWLDELEPHRYTSAVLADAVWGDTH